MHRLLRKPASERPEWRPLRDSDRLLRQHARWVAAETYRNWTGPWFTSYHYKRAGLPPGWPLEMLQPETPGASAAGVALLFDERIGGANFQHLFRLLRDRIVALGYREHQADERIWRGQSYNESHAKFLLLPTPGICPDSGRCNQRFGQISLDLLVRNRRPHFIRLTTTPLPDPGEVFSPQRSLDDLLALILGCDEERE